jgi:hypothetical protein
MERTIDVSGAVLGLFVYGIPLAGMVLVMLFVVPSLEGAASVLGAVSIVLFAAALAVGIWRMSTDRDGQHLGTAEDIAWDPYAYPAHAAKDRWAKTVRRLSDDDEQE